MEGCGASRLHLAFLKAPGQRLWAPESSQQGLGFSTDPSRRCRHKCKSWGFDSRVNCDFPKNMLNLEVQSHPTQLGLDSILCVLQAGESNSTIVACIEHTPCQGLGRACFRFIACAAMEAVAASGKCTKPKPLLWPLPGSLMMAACSTCAPHSSQRVHD